MVRAIVIVIVIVIVRVIVSSRVGVVSGASRKFSTRPFCGCHDILQCEALIDDDG